MGLGAKRYRFVFKRKIGNPAGFPGRKKDRSFLGGQAIRFGKPLMDMFGTGNPFDAGKMKDSLSLAEIRDFLRRTASANGSGKARTLRSFFKAGPGQYADGDRFYGVTVPQLRAYLKEKRLDMADSGIFYVRCARMLADGYHEMRLLALLSLVARIEAFPAEAGRAYLFYRNRVARINNWDLVDLSAPRVVGEWLRTEGDWRELLSMAVCDHLWTQRIAIVSTFAFIRSGSSAQTYAVADILLRHPHDLIRKAVGWMLREAGKRVDFAELCRYLETCPPESCLGEGEERTFVRLAEPDGNGRLGTTECGRAHRTVAAEPGIPRFRQMPRTMLRYAVERFPEPLRRRFLER